MPHRSGLRDYSNSLARRPQNPGGRDGGGEGSEGAVASGRFGRWGAGMEVASGELRWTTIDVTSRTG